jgi:Domain of unknown function (DUF6531)
MAIAVALAGLSLASTGSRADYYSAVNCTSLVLASSLGEAAEASHGCLLGTLPPGMEHCGHTFSPNGVAYGELLCRIGQRAVASGILHCDPNSEGTITSSTNGSAVCMPFEPTPDSGCNPKRGNPVAITTGNKEQSFVDWSSGGVFPLRLERRYFANYVVRSNIDGSILGAGWRTNFDAAAKYDFGSKSTLPSTPAAGHLIHISLPNGYEYSFVYNANTWRPVLPRKLIASVTWDRYRTDVRYSLVVGTSTVEFRDSEDVVHVRCQGKSEGSPSAVGHRAAH